MAPTFSSTQTPDMAQTKKAKVSTDKSTKKRKREDEQEGTPGATEPSVKKTKKRKSEGADVATPVVEQKGEPSAASTTTKDKSVKDEKKKRKAEDVEAGANGPITETPATKPKKEKKDRGSASQGVTGDAQPGAADATPAKKKRKPKADPHSNGNGDSTTEPAVVAGSSKPQQTGQAQGQTQESPEASTSMTDDQRLHSHSPFVHKTETFYLALSPCANEFPLEGLVAEHISPLLLTYYPPLRGVILKYSNARLSETPYEQGSGESGNGVVLSKAVDEYAVTFVYLTVDLVVFAPTKGSWLEGFVNLQNESLLGLVCYNYFNAAIERHRLPKDWRWVEDGSQGSTRVGKGSQGYWVDGNGQKMDGRVVFRVKDFEAAPGSESGAGSLNTLGTLLSVAEEK
ncbi:hypothetical protein B0A55_08659, partial [Friedmanniomyces simplex]